MPKSEIKMITDAKLSSEIGRLLGTLYQKRLEKIASIPLAKLLDKNPYLFRAIGTKQPADFIQQSLTAFISSSDETLFGNDFFEPLALWSAEQVISQQGHRQVTVSGGAGHDLVIQTENEYLAVAVKSSTRVYNSQSSGGQKSEFDELQSRVRKIKKQFRRIIGHGYGRRRPESETEAPTKKKSVDEKIAGQQFWSLLTEDEGYYLRISQAMGEFAKDHHQEYGKAFKKAKKKLLVQFKAHFVDAKGEILWDKVVAFNSSKEKRKALK
jgi:hypothetical protein